VVRTVTNELAFAPGFAAAFSASGLEGSGMPAAAMWRPTIAAANAVANAAANKGTAGITTTVNTAQHQTVALSQNRQLATLHTQIKQYVVTTPDAGRGNKGTSPWGFPV
jgi:hypothetical protein